MNFGACPSAADTPASTLVCTSQRPPIELWVSSSGKHMRRPLSWRGWLTRPWLQHLSGTICDPSTAALGAAAFISSLPVIPANPSAWPETDEAPEIRDTSGPRSIGSFARSTPSGSSSRTSPATSIWALPKSLKTFDAWASTSRRACSRRAKSAHPTSGPGSSLWPTPTARDGGYFPDLIAKEGRLSFTGPHDAARGSGGQFGLNTAARVWTVTWSLIKALGLTMTASPSSPPVRLSLKSGIGSSIEGLISNPDFYDLIMGWPVGWSEPRRSVTGFAAWLQRSRGQLSKLTSSPARATL